MSQIIINSVTFIACCVLLAAGAAAFFYGLRALVLTVSEESDDER
jgi:hypothetical protein